ncbi:MAG: ligase-associated DNA damage response endonuclease PdeM [Pseudomonadota bacterium]
MSDGHDRTQRQTELSAQGEEALAELAKIEREAPAATQTAASFTVAGVECVADHSGVLFWPETSTLVVADMHFEKGSSFARRGMMVPPYDTGITLSRLSDAVMRYAPSRIISLGDAFHDVGGSARMPEDWRNALVALMAHREWIWVTGNHDPEPPEGLPGTTVEEWHEGGLIFRHEPTAGPAKGEVAGHLHPAGKIARRSRAVRRPCFISDGDRLILPAFGAFTGGLNVCSEPFHGLFDRKRWHAVLVSQGNVFPIAGSELCA